MTLKMNFKGFNSIKDEFNNFCHVIKNFRTLILNC